MAGVPQSTRSLAGPINHQPVRRSSPFRCTTTNGQQPSPRTRFRDKRRPARRIKQTLLEYFMLECVRYLSAVRRINKVDYLRGRNGASRFSWLSIHGKNQRDDTRLSYTSLQ